MKYSHCNPTFRAFWTIKSYSNKKSDDSARKSKIISFKTPPEILLLPDSVICLLYIANDCMIVSNSFSSIDILQYNFLFILLIFRTIIAARTWETI